MPPWIEQILSLGPWEESDQQNVFFIFLFLSLTLLSILRMLGMKEKPITHTKEEICQNRHLGHFSPEVFNYYCLSYKEQHTCNPLCPLISSMAYVNFNKFFKCYTHIPGRPRMQHRIDLAFTPKSVSPRCNPLFTDCTAALGVMLLSPLWTQLVLSNVLSTRQCGE